MVKTAICTGNQVQVKQGISRPSGKGYAWVYASSPTQAELREIASRLKVREKILVDYTRQTRSKRYSNNPLEFVLVDYYVENEEVKSSKVLFILKENTFITITNQKSTYYDELFDRVLEAIKLNKNQRIASLLYEFLDEDIEDNYEVLRKNDEVIADMETRVIESKVSSMPVGEIVKFRRELFTMSRRFWSSAKIVFLMRRGLTPVKLNDEDRTLLDDAYDTILHQIDVIATQEEMISDALTIYATQISNEISRQVKRLTYITLVLTGITLVLSVPNTIATIFGIPYLPRELGQGTGWEAIVGILALSTLVSSAWLYSYWQKEKLSGEKS